MEFLVVIFLIGVFLGAMAGGKYFGETIQQDGVASSLSLLPLL